MAGPIRILAGSLALMLVAGGAALARPAAGGKLKSPAQGVLWSGAVERSATAPGEVPECGEVSCDRFDLTVTLPGGVWSLRAGGVNIAIRWTHLSDNLRLFVYRDGTLVASSTGIFATGQSVLIPSAENGLYSIYIAYDPDSAGDVVAYEGLADVEYLPRPHPLRQLLPDLTVRPPRQVGFETPPPLFFEPDPPAPGSSCFPSEVKEDGAQTCLRFDLIAANVGEGPLELRFALPRDPDSIEHNAFQRIYWSDGPAHHVDRFAGEWEFHPIHDHFHYMAFAVSRLWATGPGGRRLGQEPVRTSRKLSFCVIDSEIEAWGRKGDGPRTYSAPVCLFPSESDASNDYLVQGVTPGWADVYEWFLPGQYIEVSGVADGVYILETIADPDGAILEANGSNNCGSVYVRLTNMSSASPAAEILGPGPKC